MIIAAKITDIEPVYSSLHELQRATFHIDGASETFVAFGPAAETIVNASRRPARVTIAASSEVTLLSSEPALLVDSAELLAA